MAQKLTHTVEVSETPKDRYDLASKLKKQLLAVPEDQWVRQRVHSMDAVITFRKADLQPCRPRLISAPPNTAVKYGRKRRRITDEFDVLLDKKMKSMWSGRPASQIRQRA